MARNRQRDRDLTTAQANADVRYGPQRSTLNLLLGEAESQFKQEKRAAKDAALSSIRMARKARKPLAAVYNQAVGKADVARADVEQAFGEIGTAADPFRAATARESSLNRQQIADAAARANKELTDRQNEAAIGRQFALGAARQRYEGDKSQIARQLMDLEGQRGSFIAATLGDLESERRKIQENRRTQRKNRQTQLDVIEAADKAREEGLSGAKLRQEIKDAKDKKKGGGFEPASRSERRMFTTEFARALDTAGDLKKGDPKNNLPGMSRSAAARALRAGLPREQGKDAEGEFVNPAVASIKDQLALSAALDMVYKGYVTDKTMRRMHEVGLRIDRTPRAISQKQWYKQKPGASGRPVGTNNKAPF